MLVRNIHLGIVNRVYDGIASSSWENGMDVKFVFTMPTGNLDSFVERMYENWKETWIGCLTQEVLVEE